MSAPPISATDNNNNNSNNATGDPADLIKIHLSLPSEPPESDNQHYANNSGDFAPDMSLTSDNYMGDRRESRYQSLRNSTAYVPVNRPNNNPNNPNNNANNNNQSGSNSLSLVGNDGSNSSIKYNKMSGPPSSAAVTGVTGGRREKSPFFGSGKNGTQSPISSILSSGSRLLQQSMRVINLEPGSLRASTFTVITAMVGGGTLTIPYGIKMAGTVTGLLYLVLACFCCGYSTWALIYCAEKNNCASYRKLAKQLYGQKMAYFIQTMLLILLWCVCVSYMTLTKQLLSLAIYIILNEKHVWEDNQYVLLILAVIIIVLPLALMRKVSALRYASMIGLCVVTFTCGLVTVLYFEWCDGPKCVDIKGEPSKLSCEYDRHCLWKSIETVQFVNPNFLDHTYTIAIMIGGFADHPTVLPIYFEMQRRSPSRMKKCLIYGFLITLLLYVDIAYFGYFTFPDNVQQNLLSSNYRHNPVMLVSAAVLCLYVISVVPLFAHAFRKSLAELMLELKNSPTNVKKLLLNENGNDITTANDSDNNGIISKQQLGKTIEGERDFIAPEARDVLEYPEDHIAFVPSASPRTQKKLSLGHAKFANNDKNRKGSDSDDTFESADSFEMEENDNNNKNGNKKGKTQAMHDPFQLPLKTHAFVTLTFIGSALALALFAPNIGTVNALIGSTTMPLCCFVFPAMCAWKTRQAPTVMKYGTVVLAVLVMISSIFQLTRQVLEWV